MNSYQQALKEGYSDEDIYNHFAKRSSDFPEKYKTAVEEGYSPEEIFTHLTKSKEKEPQERKPLKEYGKSALKAGIKGLHGLGNLIDPFSPEKPLGVLAGKSPLLPKREELNKELEEKFPTKNATAGQQYVEKIVGDLAPIAVVSLFAPQAAPYLIGTQVAASAAGETAKQLGAPPWVQNLTEFVTAITPAGFGKLMMLGTNKEILKIGKELGFTKEEIAPLVNSELRRNWLGKFTLKRSPSGKKRLENTHAALQNKYKEIQKGELAQGTLNRDQSKQMVQELEKGFSELPEKVRQRLKDDYMNLLSGNFSADEIINFYRDVGRVAGASPEINALLKTPLKNGITAISPELGKDFENINKLYTEFYKIRKTLKPTIASDILLGGESLALVKGIFTGNPAILFTVASEQAVKKLTQQMLLNPKLQTLSKKMIHAMNINDLKAAGTYMDQFQKIIAKDNPEMAEYIEKHGKEELSKIQYPKKTKSERE